MYVTGAEQAGYRFALPLETTMYNCVPMHTLQTMQDMQRLSPRAYAAALIAAACLFLFFVSIAATI